jgi:hypothetical protein
VAYLRCVADTLEASAPLLDHVKPMIVQIVAQVKELTAKPAPAPAP